MNMKPSYEEITKLAKHYKRIPICREVYADEITPITLLRRIAQQSTRFYLLESVEGGQTWGRYSFLGFNPIMRVSCKDSIVHVEDSSSGKTVTKMIDTHQPFQVLRDILGEYKAPVIKGLPPFSGGFVGYFSYACIGYAEPTLKIQKDDGHDFDLMLFDSVIAYDHLKQNISMIVNMKTDHVLTRYEAACTELESIAKLLQDKTPLETSASIDTPEFTSNVSKEEFCRMVEKTKKYIMDGDIFQAVISRQFQSPYEGSLINAYRMLRTTNPSPYMVYMKLDDDEIISTSPETLVRLRNGRLTTFPVAGSRPRGAAKEEDAILETQLLTDEKELAEHNMLVDLGRNDIGKISKFSTVEVTKYKMIHKYSRIMHICSQVEGDIRSDCDGCSAIEAVLPAGTLSGAPKIRACQIINELEAAPRGIYGGALGYLDFTGSMDTCIAIRMAVKRNHNVYVQAGSGIVADSIPQQEYEETAHKAEAVINAIKRAGEVND